MPLHFELGRRPRQPAYPGKVDCESKCGSCKSNQAGSVGPLHEGFFVSATTIPSTTVEAYRQTEYRVYGEPAFTLRIGQPSPELLALQHAHHGALSRQAGSAEWLVEQCAGATRLRHRCGRELASFMVAAEGQSAARCAEIAATLRQQYDLTPAGTIRSLDLQRPIYYPTAAYGHFGRDDLELPCEARTGFAMR